MFCIEGNVGVVAGDTGDMREPEFGSEDDLWTEEDGVDQVQDVGIE